MIAHIRPEWVVPPPPENIGDIYKVVGYPYTEAEWHDAYPYGDGDDGDDDLTCWQWMQQEEETK